MGTPEEDAALQKEQIADLLGDDIPAEAEVAEVVPAAEPVVEPIPAVEPRPAEPAAPVVEPAPTEEEELTELPTELPTDPAELQKLLKSFAAQTTSLRGALNEMAQRGAVVPPAEVPAAAPTAPATPAPTAIVDAKDAIANLKKVIGDAKDYLTKEELDLVADKPELINVAIQRGTERMVTAFIEALPSLTGEFVKQHTAVQTVVDTFYKDNPDLVPFKKYAMTVSQEIAKDPKLSVQDLLTKTAVEVRKNLRLPAPKAGAKPSAPAAPVTRASTQKPAFAQQRRAVAPAAKASDPNSKQAQIKDLLS